MNSVIDEAQSAFLPGRLITDNAIIVSEVFYSINISSSKRDPHMVLKLDMSKEFYRIEIFWRSYFNGWVSLANFGALL